MRPASEKMCDWDETRDRVRAWQESGESVVMTNGTFDLLHAGHTGYLEWARQQGDRLIVGLNTDASIKRIKGDKRPLVEESHRANLLAALESVDVVVLFDQDEPIELISRLLPDVLVKAEDWSHYVSGGDIVKENGGEVRLAPMMDGVSTSSLIDRICQVFTGNSAKLDPQKQREENG